MKKHWALALAVFFCSGLVLAVAPQPMVVGRFSAMSPGDAVAGWESMTFSKIDRHTLYSVVELDGKTVLRADSNASASGLIKKIDVDPMQYPLLTWEWRVANILTKGDVRTKAGDDYAARIYITFSETADRLPLYQRVKRAAIEMLYGVAPPSAAIAYIWANHAEVDSVYPNAYTDRCRMIVVESGPVHLNQWRSVRRDIVADFRRAFGDDPPRISGIAVMTDTDNTAASATAWYGDLVLHPRADQ